MPIRLEPPPVQSLTDTLRMELERERAAICITLIEPAAIDAPFPGLLAPGFGAAVFIAKRVSEARRS